MNKVVAEERKITKEILNRKYSDDYKIGDKYTVFIDPKTNKEVRPVDGFTVIANDGDTLNDKFIEI